MEKKQTSAFIALGITGVWLFVSLFVMSKHEMWLDEAQHWLLARDSDSLGELYRNMKYEGHPPLWNLLLFLLSAFSDSPALMQYVHLLFAAGTVFIVVHFSPFPLWVKVVLPFTFFFGYEYAIIARNYAPAVFFILLACVWAREYERNLLRIACALGVAFLFHLYAGGIAVVMLAYFQWQFKQKDGNLRVRWTAWTILVLCGAIALWSLLRVPSDHFIQKYHSSLFEFERVGTVMLLPFTSLMHVPPPVGEFWWNQNMFLQGPDIAKGIIGLLFWWIPMLIIRKNRVVLVMYLCGTVLLSILMLLTPMAVTVRHAGFVGLMFFVCVWLGGNSLFENKLSRISIVVILFIQMVGFVFTARQEYWKKFSNSESVAGYVNANYHNLPVAAFPDFVRPSLSLYLGRDIYFPNTKGNFATWNSSGLETKPEYFISECKDYMRANDLDSLVIVSHRGLQMFQVNPPEGTVPAMFMSATVAAENYQVFILTNE